jgi:hypothetical protein
MFIVRIIYMKVQQLLLLLLVRFHNCTANAGVDASCEHQAVCRLSAGGLM